MDQWTTDRRPTELTGARVLLVEDERLILMELEAVLEDAGAIVAGSCSNLGNALAAVTRGGIDAALLDIHLAREDIAPVAQALQERGIPFVFYSGHQAGDPIQLRWPDATVIQKPAQAWRIVSALAQAIDIRAGAR